MSKCNFVYRWHEVNITTVNGVNNIVIRSMDGEVDINPPKFKDMGRAIAWAKRKVDDITTPTVWINISGGNIMQVLSDYPVKVSICDQDNGDEYQKPEKFYNVEYI